MDENDNKSNDDDNFDIINGSTSTSNPSCSNRVLRNLAEKMRRDKLNTYINELAALVPMVSTSTKRMDKTSVLRLSATFIRQHKLVSSTKVEEQIFPAFLNNSVDWSQLLLDDMDGIMLVVTSIGKIVFISDTIEKVLGHTQLELLGQSLYNITCPEDHELLKRCLAPDNIDENIPDSSCESEDTNTSDSEPVSSRFFNKSSSLTYLKSGDSGCTKQRRSFYLRLRHRCIARSEPPQYELVFVMGHLRVPKEYNSQAQKKILKHKVEVTSANSNEIILVSVMKPFRERRVTEDSLIEASRDEYITRHLLDGRIIYSDHRIAVVSGYLSEEVSGLQAFHFMHKDDVRWVMIALRQMFLRNESYGSSVYRLKTKTGEFIYLKTYGYLELNSSSDQCVSFICVNSLLSPIDGEREIRLMKKRFSALIEKEADPEILAIADNSQLAVEDPAEVNTDCVTEDPEHLKPALQAMIAHIPNKTTPANEDTEKLIDTQFAKAKLMSKALPPVSVDANNIIIEEKLVVKSQHKLSPKSTSVCSPRMLPQLQPSTSAVSPQSSLSCNTTQNRPSVLRIAPPNTSRRENSVITSGNSTEKEKNNKESSAFSVDAVENQKYNMISPNGKSPRTIVKEEEIVEPEITTIDTDKLNNLQNDFVGQNNNNYCNSVERSSVVRRVDNPLKHSISERVPVVHRDPIKRTLDSEQQLFSSVPNKKSYLTLNSAEKYEIPQLQHQQQSAVVLCNNTFTSNRPVRSMHKLTTQTTKKDFDQILDADSSQITDQIGLTSINQCNDQLICINPFEAKSEPEEVLQLLDNANEDIKRSHNNLESRLNIQGEQINAIEGDLDGVSFTSKQFCFHSDLSQLKEQHVKQKQLLMTLQQDHHSLQHCSADLNVSSSLHQNVGA